MAERKVLNKYYPPDYDPSKIPRIRRKDKQHDVRVMAPFNMQCSNCKNYIANGTKFNSKKEEVKDETYHELKIVRFYIKCPRCMATIIYRTDLKNKGYKVEHGATENFMAMKLAEQKAIEEAEAEEEEEKINPMKHLEKRTKASKLQMETSEQLQQLKSIKHKHHNVNIDDIIQSKRQKLVDDPIESITDKDDDIRAEAEEILKRKAIDMGGESSAVSSNKISIGRVNQSSSTRFSSLSSLKKKIKIIPKSQNSSLER